MLAAGKSDMYLLLGLAEKARQDGSAARVEQYLRNVTTESKAYEQAQLIIGDIYLEKGLREDAVKAYTNALRSPDRAMLVITHYQRLLDYIVPDKVHVMSAGKIVKSGGKELALELEKEGYAAYAA